MKNMTEMIKSRKERKNLNRKLLLKGFRIEEEDKKPMIFIGGSGDKLFGIDQDVIDAYINNSNSHKHKQDVNDAVNDFQNAVKKAGFKKVHVAINDIIKIDSDKQHRNECVFWSDSAIVRLDGKSSFKYDNGVFNISDCHFIDIDPNETSPQDLMANPDLLDSISKYGVELDYGYKLVFKPIPYEKR